MDRSKWAVGGLGIVAVVVAVWLLTFWWGSTPPTVALPGDPPPGFDAASSLTAGTAGEPAGGDRRIAKPSAVTGEEGEPPTYRDALGGLQGRLVWRATRSPVVDTEVAAVELSLDTLGGSLDSFHATTMREPALFRARTRTDLDGNFVLPGLHSRATLVLAIGLQTPAAAVRFVDRMPGPGETVELGEVELLERGGVDGRVVDPEGKPVVGARVRVLDLPRSLFALGATDFRASAPVLVTMGGLRVGMDLPAWVAKYDALLPFAEATTGGNGQFKVRGARPGKAILLVTHPRFAKRQRRVTIVPRTAPDLGRVQLGFGEPLTGRFLDGRGQPVAGVEVTAGTPRAFSPFGWCRVPVRSDDDGRFVLPGLGRGSVWLMYRRAPGSAWEIVGPHRSGETLRLVLEPLADGKITVERATGARIRGADLALYDVYAAAFLPGFERRIAGAQHLSERTPGQWSVRGVPAGEYKVVARKPGFALGTGVLDLRHESEQRAVRLVLAEAPAQRFEVRDLARQPIAGARIYWHAARGRSEAATFHKGGKARLTEAPVLLGNTNRSGNLVTTTVEADARFFVCRHPAYGLATSGKQGTGRAPIRFVLRAGGAVAGRVVDQELPPDAPKAVRARPGMDLKEEFGRLLPPRYTTTLPDGSFRFEGLEVGQWWLEVVPAFGSATSLAAYNDLAGVPPSASTSVMVFEGGSSEATLDMSAAALAEGRGRIFGQVRSNGRAVAGGRVVVARAKGRRVEAVDEQSEYSVAGLPAATFDVRFERPGGDGFLRNCVWQRAVALLDGQQLRLDIALREAPLTVRVAGPGGRPVPGLVVRLVRTTEAGGLGVDIGRATDREGRARFGMVPSGLYEIRGASIREPEWVFADGATLRVGFAESEETVWVTPSAVLEGYVELDESGLDPAQKEFARRRPPKQIVLRQGDRFLWGPLKARAASRADQPTRLEFRLRGAGPGLWHIVPRSALRWQGPPFALTVGEDRQRVLVLRPAADALPKRADK